MSQTIHKLIPDPLPLFQTLHHKKCDTSLSFPSNSRWTKQSFKDECDINTIMSRYQSTGEMPVLNEVAPQYLDCPAESFQDMLNFCRGAEELFAQIPSKLRARFGNDPAQFLDYVADEANIPEMRQLGLLKDAHQDPASDAGDTNAA